jgi:murein tripeptide amidase MpaA
MARTIEYVAQRLVQGYKSGDNVTQAFLDNYDFYIFPFVNPDGMFHPVLVFPQLILSGFIYTQTNERLWRKNRSRHHQPRPIRPASVGM